MAIELRTFASGDTDYIAKLNANYSTIKQAIDMLQLQIGAIGGGGELDLGMFFNALFNGADALIGPGAYEPTLSASTATIAAGGMYLSASQNVVSKLTSTDVSFAGQTADTYYIVIDSLGVPARSDTLESGAAYSVVWSGAAFVGDPTRIAPAFFDTLEAAASRESDALVEVESPPIGPTTLVYDTLDDRLEAGEAVAMAAQDSADEALAFAYELEAAIAALEGAVTTPRVRKVGVTVTETGVAGAIQADFYGTIIGWSVIADAAGDLEVEVSIASSSAPPADPTIPDVVTDKVSASAPIELSSAQSAASAEAGVSTWDTAVDEWDVIQFNVLSLSTLTRATLYLRIEEITSP